MQSDDLLTLYRIKNYKNKLSWTKCLAITFLGLFLSGNTKFQEYVLDIVLMVGIFMFGYSWNDYWDFIIEKDNNAVSALINKKNRGKKIVVLLTILPLTVLPFSAFFNKMVVLLTILIVALQFLYSVPKIRLKEKAGSLCCFICFTLQFLQGYFVAGKMSINLILLTAVFLLFNYYSEYIHQLSDTDAVLSKKRIKDLKKVGAVPFYSFLFFIPVSLFFNRLFLVTVFFWFVRFFSVRKLNEKTSFTEVRKNFLSPVYSVYELLIYGALGFFGLF